MGVRFTLKSEVDFIAFAPAALGFNPTRSLVMMTMNSFHARVDLPEDEQSADMCIEALLSPTVRHNVKQVAFLVYDEGDHEAFERELLRRFGEQGVAVIAALEVGDDKYRPFFGAWTPVDIAALPMTLEAQYNDLGPKHRTRAELAAYVKPCQADMDERTRVVIEALRVHGYTVPMDCMRRATAKQSVEIWTDVLRALEPGDELVPDAAIVLAFAAWLSGDGALAWVALDQADESTTWHRLITSALEQAVDPSKWDESVDGL